MALHFLDTINIDAKTSARKTDSQASRSRGLRAPRMGVCHLAAMNPKPTRSHALNWIAPDGFTGSQPPKHARVAGNGRRAKGLSSQHYAKARGLHYFGLHIFGKEC